MKLRDKIKEGLGEDWTQEREDRMYIPMRDFAEATREESGKKRMSMSEQTMDKEVKEKQEETARIILDLLLSTVEAKARKDSSFPRLVKFFEKMTPAEMCAIVFITSAK